MEGIVIEPQYISYLRNNGYNIERVNETKVAKSEESDTAHLLMEVKTYLYPINHPKLDVAEHEITLRACDCWSFRNNTPDVSTSGVLPTSYVPCKHLEHWDKHSKAETDEKQTELV